MLSSRLLMSAATALLIPVGAQAGTEDEIYVPAGSPMPPGDFGRRVLPIIHPETIAKLGEHTKVIPDGNVIFVANTGFVIGSKAVLVIEAGFGISNGKKIYETARKLAGKRAIYLATTHAHPEHDLGAIAFSKSVKLIRSRAQQADLSNNEARVNVFLSSYAPAYADIIRGVPFRNADILFDEEYVLDLGGVTARIMSLGGNHTDGDTAIWVPKDGILFAGDLAMKRQPILSATNVKIAHWLGTLDRLEALGPKIVVPSHGPIGDQALIHGYRNYLTEVRDRTAAAKAKGLPLDETTSSVIKEMVGRYPGQIQLKQAIGIAYNEGK